MAGSTSTTLTTEDYHAYWHDFAFASSHETRYLEQAHIKKNYWLKQLGQQLSLSPDQLKSVNFFYSAPKHFRHRIEFAVRRFAGRWHYAMFDRDHKQPIPIYQCQQSATPISEAMPKLMAEINAHPSVAHRLIQINFRCNKDNELLITLVYRQNLDEKAKDFYHTIKQWQRYLGWHIIVRSHKKQWACGKAYLNETLMIDKQTYTYWQDDHTFTQPNTSINQHMLNWVNNHLTKEATQTDDLGNLGDLLELYCGNGNFSIALAHQFQKVLSTEVVRQSLKLAQQAKVSNAITNIDFIRLSAEETAQALSGYRPFTRLRHIDLDQYHFSTILVDPPRSGIDEKTLPFLQLFKRIIYISCNPNTLIDNLNHLSSHRIQHLALFDQFPYTPHIETAVILTQ